MNSIKYIVLLFLFASNCNATIYNVNKIKINIQGFLGWKTIWTQDNQRFDSVSDFPEMGLITTANLTDHLQAYFFGRYGRTLESAVVYAELRYSLPNIVDDLHLGIRGGQLINNIGLYNETRVNPRTRATIWLPQSIYPATIKGELASGLGVGIDGNYKNISFGYSILRKTIFNDVSEAKEWSTRLQSVDNFFGDSQIAYLQYKGDDWRTKLTYVDIKLGNDFAGVPRNISINLPKASNSFLILSGEWQINDKWYISAEGYMSKQKPSTLPSGNNIYAYSIMGRHELTDDITLYANWNQFLSPFNSTNLTPTERLRERHNELILGGNWHPGNWQLGLEAHHVQGGRFVTFSNFINSPEDYRDFWIFGGNLVYFWD